MKKECLFYEEPKADAIMLASGATFMQTSTFDDALNPDYDEPYDL